MILYYLKETFNSFINSKLASLLIITTTAIAIIFISLSVGLITFSKSINSKLKDNIRISLFVSDTVSGVYFQNIEDELKQNVFVDSYKFISKKEALRKMKERTGQDFLTVLEANPLPAAYLIKLYSDSISTLTIAPIIETLKSVKGIDDVVYDYSLTLKILNFINSSKKIIYGISLFLLLLSIYLVYSNNKLMLSARFDQFNTMKLVGAKLSTIKIPIFLNGIILGAIAAGLCLGIFYLVFYFGAKFYRIDFIQFERDYIVALVILLGMFLGFLGSFLATLNITLRINKK